MGKLSISYFIIFTRSFKWNNKKNEQNFFSWTLQLCNSVAYDWSRARGSPDSVVVVWVRHIFGACCTWYNMYSYNVLSFKPRVLKVFFCFCFKQEQMRDEVYCQLIKQLTGNKIKYAQIHKSNLCKAKYKRRTLPVFQISPGVLWTSGRWLFNCDASELPVKLKVEYSNWLILKTTAIPNCVIRLRNILKY